MYRRSLCPVAVCPHHRPTTPARRVRKSPGRMKVTKQLVNGNLVNGNLGTATKFPGNLGTATEFLQRQLGGRPPTPKRVRGAAPIQAPRVGMAPVTLARLPNGFEV